MRYGIQRRGVYLAPPSGTEMAWIADVLDQEEVWRAFGHEGPAGQVFLERRCQTTVGVIHRAVERSRVGFMLAFAPTEAVPVPELAYALPRRHDRDAFTALTAADLMTHYLMDHEGYTTLAWRTRTSNLAAQAILRRLGYPPAATIRVDGHAYTFHRLDRSDWLRRRARIEAYEKSRPFGLGAPFIVLERPPWDPIVPSISVGATA